MKYINATTKATSTRRAALPTPEAPRGSRAGSGCRRGCVARRCGGRARPPEILRVAEPRRVDRDHQAVLPVPAPLGGVLQRFGEQCVRHDKAGDAFDHQGEAGALGSRHRQRNLRGLGIGRRFSVLVERPSGGNRLSGFLRLVQPSHRDDAGPHVQHDRTLFATRNSDRNRARGNTRRARSVIRHVRPGSRERDRRHAFAGGGERVIAERRRVRGCPDQREPDAGVPGLAHRFGGRPRHRDRAGGAIGVDQDRGRRFGADRDRRTRIHVAAFYQIDIARDPRDAVRVDAPEIGPDEDVRDDRRIGLGHAGAREDLRRETPERVGRSGRRRPIGVRLRPAHAGIRAAAECACRASCARGSPPACCPPRT